MILDRALINMKFNFIPWPSKSLRFLTYHHFVKFYKRLLFWMKSNCKLKIQKQKLEKNLRECKIQNHSKRTRKGLNTRKKQFLRCYITKSWWHYFFNISIDNLLCCNNSFLQKLFFKLILCLNIWVYFKTTSALLFV